MAKPRVAGHKRRRAGTSPSPAPAAAAAASAASPPADPTAAASPAPNSQGLASAPSSSGSSSQSPSESPVGSNSLLQDGAEPALKRRKTFPPIPGPTPQAQTIINDALSRGIGATAERPVRIYMDGIFDMFHAGHARAFQQAKSMFPHAVLLVGCCNDQITHELKGRTLMEDWERYESLRHCRWVDQVIEDAPWFVTTEFLDLHNIDFVAHDGDPYPGDVYAHVRAMGRFLPTLRTEGISTTDLIVRIVREYETFVVRNLKRGYTPKDMNISFLRAQQIKLADRVSKASESVKSEISHGIREFLTGYDRNRSRIKDFMVEQKEKLESLLTGQSLPNSPLSTPRAAESGDSSGAGRPAKRSRKSSASPRPSASAAASSADPLGSPAAAASGAAGKAKK